jgi:hypothetical protein
MKKQLLSLLGLFGVAFGQAGPGGGGGPVGVALSTCETECETELAACEAVPACNDTYEVINNPLYPTISAFNASYYDTCTNENYTAGCQTAQFQALYECIYDSTCWDIPTTTFNTFVPGCHYYATVYLNITVYSTGGVKSKTELCSTTYKSYFETIFPSGSVGVSKPECTSTTGTGTGGSGRRLQQLPGGEGGEGGEEGESEGEGEGGESSQGDTYINIYVAINYDSESDYASDIDDNTWSTIQADIDSQFANIAAVDALFLCYKIDCCDADAGDNTCSDEQSDQCEEYTPTTGDSSPSTMSTPFLLMTIIVGISSLLFN